MRLDQYPSEQAGRPLRRRRAPLPRVLLKGAVIVLLVFFIAVCGMALLLIAGPTEFGIVRDRVASIIRDNLGEGYEVTTGAAYIDIDPVLGLVTRIDDISVKDSANAVVAFVPSTRFAIEPWSLLRLRVDVKQIELSSPEVSFARAADGAIYLGNAQTNHGIAAAAPALPPAEIDAADGGFPDLVAALYLIDRSIEPQIEGAIAGGFERFAVVNGTVNLFEAGQEGQRRFAGTDLNVGVDRQSQALNVTLGTSGFGGRWTAQIDRQINVANGGHTMSAVFSQLTAADIIPSLGDENSLVTADVPLFGRASIRFGPNGDIEDANARLDIGAGIFRFAEERETVLLDEATIKVHWDVANRALILDPSTFYVGNTRGVVTGRIAQVGEEGDRRYSFEIESPGSIFAPADSGEAPIVAQRAAVSGVLDLKAKVLNIENAILIADDAAVAAAGSIGFDGPTPSLALAATFSPMKVSSLKQIWAPMIAPGARRWVLDHVGGGRLVAGRFEAAIPAGVDWLVRRPVIPDDAIRLTMQLEGVDFTVLGKLPPIINAAGNIVVSGQTVGVDLERGMVNVPSGTVTVLNGAFAIPNTHVHPADGLIEIQLDGPAAALAEIADADPLFALRQQGLRPDDLSGSGAANISVRMQMRPDLTDADVDWKVVVNTRKLTSDAPVEGRKISDADVSLTVVPGEISIYGKAKIDGVGADVSMAFPFGADASEAAESGADRRIRLVLDDAARKKLGVGLEEVISGTVNALVTDVANGTQHYDLDLRRARVVLPGVGWAKGIGVPASLSFDMKPSGKGYAVENLKLEGEGFGFSGSAQLDETYNLVSADIDRLALHAGDSVALKLTRGKSGYAITARGASFDMRGMITEVRDRNQQSGGYPDLAIDAQIDRLIGYNKEEIQGASLTLVSIGGSTQKIAFNGTLGGQDVSLNYSVQPGGTTLQGSTANAGALLRFADLYTHMVGGKLTLTGQARRDGAMNGTAEVDDFAVVDEPAMARVAATAPDTVAGKFNPNSVHFARMVARFRKTDSVLAVEDALLAGASVGATFAGRYDFTSTNISITGTYLPAYALNNMFGRIPVLGIFTGGGQREGLFGVTFKIDGPIGQPTVYFNALSAVAPGIFRKIFEFQQTQ